ncbi:hypothetical protein YC2023_075025 [Brassica napus]
MSRDIGELSESDEGEQDLSREEPDLRREEPDLSREEPNELASLWSGPVTRSKLRAQEERLQEIAKIVGLGSRQGDQDKPACWFNLITLEASIVQQSAKVKRSGEWRSVQRTKTPNHVKDHLRTGIDRFAWSHSRSSKAVTVQKTGTSQDPRPPPHMDLASYQSMVSQLKKRSISNVRRPPLKSYQTDLGQRVPCQRRTKILSQARVLQTWSLCWMNVTTHLMTVLRTFITRKHWPRIPNSKIIYRSWVTRQISVTVPRPKGEAVPSNGERDDAPRKQSYNPQQTGMKSTSQEESDRWVHRTQRTGPDHGVPPGTAAKKEESSSRGTHPNSETEPTGYITKVKHGLTTGVPRKLMSCTNSRNIIILKGANEQDQVEATADPGQPSMKKWYNHKTGDTRYNCKSTAIAGSKSAKVREHPIISCFSIRGKQRKPGTWWLPAEAACSTTTQSWPASERQNTKSQQVPIVASPRMAEYGPLKLIFRVLRKNSGLRKASRSRTHRFLKTHRFRKMTSGSKDYEAQKPWVPQKQPLGPEPISSPSDLRVQGIGNQPRT